MITYLVIEICLLLIIAYFISKLDVLFVCIKNEEDLNNLSSEEDSKVIVNGIACSICIILLLINSVLLYISF